MSISLLSSSSTPSSNIVWCGIWPFCIHFIPYSDFLTLRQVLHYLAMAHIWGFASLFLPHCFWLASNLLFISSFLRKINLCSSRSTLWFLIHGLWQKPVWAYAGVNCVSVKPFCSFNVEYKCKTQNSFQKVLYPGIFAVKYSCFSVWFFQGKSMFPSSLTESHGTKIISPPPTI